MKKNIGVMIVVLILITIVAGVIIKFVSNMPKPSVIVAGTVLFQEQQPLHVSATYPVGYYLKAGALDRVYLDYSGVEGYLGKEIWARGYLETVLGADGLRRLPCIVITQLTEPNRAPR